MTDELKEFKTVYFIGIGGIGMSALARFFKIRGSDVSGYDKTATVLTKELEAEGIGVHYEEDPGKVPAKADLVVYTPAVPDDHKELIFYRQQGVRILKRSEVLEIITKSSFNICIAGTHGKTTVSSMVAHLLRDSGYGCTAFLGGIAVNYGTNFWTSESETYVIEADEYDRSFLKLNPDIAIITAMDADHLDIYGTAEVMEQAFIDFSKKVRQGGLVIGKFGLRRTNELKTQKFLSYSLQNGSADIYADNIMMKEGNYEFEVHIKGKTIKNLVLQMGGMHNVENAVAAIGAASSLGIEDESIRSALAGYRGVRRRFEYIIKNDRLVFIDDYAHHPEELRVLINGAKALFRQRKCTVIFQPHLYSRTRDLADGFAEALDLADEVILLPIYPARETPIEGVMSEMISERMNNDKAKLMDKDQLVEWIKNNYKRSVNAEFGNILIAAGAGDIDMLIEPVKKILNEV